MGGYIGEAVAAVIVTAERHFLPIFLPTIGKRQEPEHTVLVFLDSLHFPTNSVLYFSLLLAKPKQSCFKRRVGKAIV